MSAWSFLKVAFEIEHLVDHVAYCCSLSNAMWSKNNDGLNRALVLSAAVDMQSGDALCGMQLKCEHTTYSDVIKIRVRNAGVGSKK